MANDARAVVLKVLVRLRRIRELARDVDREALAGLIASKAKGIPRARLAAYVCDWLRANPRYLKHGDLVIRPDDPMIGPWAADRLVPMTLLPNAEASVWRLMKLRDGIGARGWGQPRVYRVAHA